MPPPTGAAHTVAFLSGMARVVGMHPRAKLLLALAPVPLLLAPVRLQDAALPGLQNLGGPSPAMQAYSLPSAQPLATPTVIMVSPTGFDAPPTPTTVPPPRAATPPPPAAAPAPANLMPLMASQLCQHALATTTELTLLSYESSQKPATAALTVVATAAAAQASTRTWPDMQTFGNALKKLPWGTPYGKEIATTGNAALKMCRNPAAGASHGIGRSQVPIPRPN